MSFELSDKIQGYLKPICDDPQFTPENVKMQSDVCSGMCLYVRLRYENKARMHDIDAADEAKELNRKLDAVVTK